MTYLYSIITSHFNAIDYSGLQKFAENAKTNFTPWELLERIPEVTLDTFGSM